MHKPEVNRQETQMGGEEQIDFSRLSEEVYKTYLRGKIGGIQRRSKNEESALEERNEARIEGTTFEGKRHIKWSLKGDINKDLTPDFMKRVSEKIKNQVLLCVQLLSESEKR